MLLISLGPRPDVYLADAPEQPTKLPAGTAGVPKEVSVFYGETRGRVFPWTFSLVSIIAPIVVFAAATYLAVKMFDASQLVHGPQTPRQLPVADVCGLPGLDRQLQTRAFASMIPFAAMHIALLTVCVVAYGVSVVCTHNVLDTHKVLGKKKLWGWAVPIAVPLVAAGVVFGSASFFLGSAYRILPHCYSHFRKKAIVTSSVRSKASNASSINRRGWGSSSLLLA